ncbi:hypothetical protein KI688_001291 [Linnemannia hyalina]|uniref:Uncharacterized protein n=1 Tax=Linnemannia hyalina TaxID=64524 RepID=A0A9P8BUL4_9FUNG|nr:hypothetical protein KI688_001291 [Linnemannia hyalina]
MPGSESESESDIDLDHPHGYLIDEDEEQDEPSLFEPPPSYEQSVAALSTTSSSTSSSSTSRQQQHSSRSNPFLQNNSNDGRGFAQGLSSSHHGQQFSSSSSDQEIFAPSIAPQHPPSAPPLNLLASTSSNNINHHSSSSRIGGPSLRTSRTLGDLNSTTANTFNSNTTTTTATYTTIHENDSTAGERRSSTLRGKRAVKNRHNITNTDDDYHKSNINNDVETLAFGEQAATSPSYMHPSATSSSTSVASSQLRGDQDYYFNPQNGDASTGQQRTARRLQHKQAHARHSASAPNLHPRQPQPHEISAARAAAVADALQAPRVPLSQSVIPAPPPRLLQFRSREPSSVPACPFLLCQKPIAYTKTRRERGVTVWIVCGLLFLCNTYWTTQSLISYFSPPNHDQVYSQDTADTLANSGFSAKGEASHLVKGFLGFKTHRYKDPQFKKYQRHQSALKRPTIATVGVVQDDTSALRAVLSFLLMAVMAIVRWWMCLTPLLIRPLFDTVHSCPHPHLYPFPEELEQERKEKEEEDRREEEEFRRQLVRQQSLQEGLTWASWRGGDEKERLRARDEAERAAAGGGGTSTPSDDFLRDTKGQSGHNYNNNPSTEGETQEPPVTSTPVPETAVGEEDTDKDKGKSKDKKSQKGDGRFKFWRRFRAARQQRQEQGKQVLATTVIQFKKKQLSWRARRELKKKEERRKAIIKASQDIGRFSLLFQLGSFLLLDRWGQSTIVGPGKQQQQH